MGSLKVHKRVHAKRYNCTVCLYKADSEKELKEHTERRHSEKYECELCDFVSQQKADISEHERKDHNITKVRKQYDCNKCENIYRYEAELKSHNEKEHSHNQRRSGSGYKYSYQERNTNSYCRFWNHAQCSLGESCKILHEEAPLCRFQEVCSKPRCQFFHEEYAKSGNQSSGFLGVRPSHTRGRRRF